MLLRATVLSCVALKSAGLHVTRLRTDRIRESAAYARVPRSGRGHESRDVLLYVPTPAGMNTTFVARSTVLGVSTHRLPRATHTAIAVDSLWTTSPRCGFRVMDVTHKTAACPRSAPVALRAPPEESMVGDEGKMHCGPKVAAKGRRKGEQRTATGSTARR